MSEWMDWKGGECPVPAWARVDIRCRDGSEDITGLPAEHYYWKSGIDCKIIAYRLHCEDKGDMVMVPREIVSFLLGNGDLDGCSFGEKPAHERGNFWWRNRLRSAIKESQS